MISSRGQTNTAALLLLSGWCWVSGCSRSSHPTHPEEATNLTLQLPSVGIPSREFSGPIKDGAPIPLQFYPSLESLEQKPLLATNSLAFRETVRRLTSLERWLTSVEGSPVLSSRTRRTPANDAAVADLQYLLNILNHFSQELYKIPPWKPLQVTGSFNDGATGPMVRRAQANEGRVADGNFGADSFFAIRAVLEEEVLGLAPRLHRVLKTTVLAENASITNSPNVNPFTRYPMIARFCAEPARRIIEPASSDHAWRRDAQLVVEIQHCLLRLGYNFDFPHLRQTGRRDNVTDEALKRFSRDFLRKSGPIVLDQNLVRRLVFCSTGFQWCLGILNGEFNSNPYARDPYQTY